MLTLTSYGFLRRVNFAIRKNHGAFLLLSVCLFASCQKDIQSGDSKSLTTSQNASLKKQTQASVSLFASGFTNPRGLKFGPDGNLYVAEAGPGGTQSSVGLCGFEVPQYF